MPKKRVKLTKFDEHIISKIYGRENWFQIGEIAMTKFVTHTNGISFFRYVTTHNCWQLFAHAKSMDEIFAPLLCKPMSLFSPHDLEGEQ